MFHRPAFHAMGELQRRQRQPHMAIARRVTMPMTHAWPTPVRIFATYFSFCYGVRVGIRPLLHDLKLARKRSYSSLLDLKHATLVYFLMGSLVHTMGFDVY
ncbi:hypothetical protein GQ457_01G010210 [Hibiscus cannabinus]